MSGKLRVSVVKLGSSYSIAHALGDKEHFIVSMIAMIQSPLLTTLAFNDVKDLSKLYEAKEELLPNKKLHALCDSIGELDLRISGSTEVSVAPYLVDSVSFGEVSALFDVVEVFPQ